MFLVDFALILLAPFVGSFLALMADRMGREEPLWAPRSHCDHCGRTLGLRDLVPILSFLLQRGKSRCCGKALRPSLILIELICLLITLWAAAKMEGVHLWLTVGLGWTLLGLSVIDLRTFRLPDAGTIPLLIAGLFLAAARITGPAAEHVWGAAAGFLAFAAIAEGYRLLRGTEGLGLGDAKLLGAAGAWVGLMALPSVLIWACAAGLAHAYLLGRAEGGLSRQTAIPFGPALAFGFWVTWLYGPLIFG